MRNMQKDGTTEFCVFRCFVNSALKLPLEQVVLARFLIALARKSDPRCNVCRLRRNVKDLKIGYFVHFGETGESPDTFVFYRQHNKPRFFCPQHNIEYVPVIW